MHASRQAYSFQKLSACLDVRTAGVLQENTGTLRAAAGVVATCLGTCAGQDIIQQAPCPELRAQEAAGGGSKSEDAPKLPLWSQEAAERERQPEVVMTGLDLVMPTYIAEAPKVGAKTTEENEAY